MVKQVCVRTGARTSLAVQWLRTWASLQEAQVPPLVVDLRSMHSMHAVECGQKKKKLEKISGQMGPTGEFSPEQAHPFWMLCYLLTLL